MKDKQLLKKILLLVVAIGVIGYLVFSLFYYGRMSRNQVCEKFEVIVRDSTKTKFVTKQDIVGLVKRYHLDPVGKSFGRINTLAIRDTIMTNRLVASVQVYTTPGGSVVAAVTQRKPVLMVFSDKMGKFYVDEERSIMPYSSNFALYLPIATGAIDAEMARNELYDFALYLRSHPDWDAWVVQIVVRENGDVELVPRVGDFRIVMGSLEDYPAKLAKFARFVHKGLSVVGWNRYSEINLKFDRQVVCTRK